MKTEATKRVGIYARVSTSEKGQDPDNQLRQLRQYAENRGFSIVGEFVDQASGRSEQRKQYQSMMEWVRKRKIDIVLVWRYDRIRPIHTGFGQCPCQLQEPWVDFISYQEILIQPPARGVDFLYYGIACPV